MKRSHEKRRRAIVKEHFSRYYYSFMPEKKHHRILIWVVFLVGAGLIVVQLLYPVNRALPLARLGNTFVGWREDIELQAAVNKQFELAKMRFAAGENKTEEYRLASAGAEPKTTKMVEALIDYPFWLRWVPGSILWQMPRIAAWQLTINETRLGEFSRQVSTKLTRPAVNASLSIEQGQLVAKNESVGAKVIDSEVAAAIRQGAIAYLGVQEVRVASQPQLPSRTAKDLAEVKDQAERALARPLNVTANSKQFIPSREEKAAWLNLADSPEGKTTLNLNREKLQQYIDQVISRQAGREAGATKVTLENGREVGREAGPAGLKVNTKPLMDLLEKYLLWGEGSAEIIAEMVEVPPKVLYSTGYTATREGLQAYVNDKTRWNTWISVRQLTGEQWAVGARDTESVVSGSTYKLFVALYLFKEMNEGKRSWNTPILGTSTNVCFDRMTIASTNPCAEEWLRQFGRTTLNNYIYSRGFSSATTFTHPEAVHTSARDLTSYMVGLERGTLVSSAQRERLLHSLSRHPYRTGIPAGSKGRVWNKVGFVWDYTNDTAIIHHPRGSYVLTILTRGQSYGAIARMTREIEQIMYP